MIYKTGKSRYLTVLFGGIPNRGCPPPLKQQLKYFAIMTKGVSLKDYLMIF